MPGEATYAQRPPHNPMPNSRTRRLGAGAILTIALSAPFATAQHSVAREWNEILLDSIRRDNARPTVHARNLYHLSAAMWDAWATFDTSAKCVMFHESHPTVAPNVNALREEAISYAAYRLLDHRFANSPGREETMAYARQLLEDDLEGARATLREATGLSRSEVRTLVERTGERLEESWDQSRVAQAVEAGLGRGVGSHAGDRHPHDRRADQHHVAPAALDHGRHERGAEALGGQEVDGDVLGERVGVGPEGGAGNDVAGVRHEDVDLALGRDGRVGEGGDGRRVGQVEVQRDRLATGVADGGRLLRAALDTPGAEDDGVAGGAEQPRRGGPDARRGTGDDRGTALGVGLEGHDEVTGAPSRAARRSRAR